MKKLIIILCVLFLSSCKTSIQQNETSENKEKKEWIFAFKANAFYKCMVESGAKIDKDASPSLNFEVLGNFKTLKKTDSIGKNYSKIIKDRSVWLGSEGHKAICNGCLVLYESKELDSIANAEYKKHMHSKR